MFSRYQFEHDEQECSHPQTSSGFDRYEINPDTGVLYEVWLIVCEVCGKIWEEYREV